jgi:hypothetical protein
MIFKLVQHMQSDHQTEPQNEKKPLTNPSHQLSAESATSLNHKDLLCFVYR